MCEKCILEAGISVEAVACIGRKKKKKDAADGCAAETFDSGDLVTSESLASLKFAGGRHLLAIDQ